MAAKPFSNIARRLLLAGAVIVTASVALTGSVALAAPGAPTQATAPSPRSTRVPQPVAITADPATTAYLLLDLTTAVCAPKPACVATLPAAAALLAKARAAGATVIYSQTSAAGSQILPQVAPLPGDPIVTAHADKFFGTSLDQILTDRGIQTLVIV